MTNIEARLEAHYNKAVEHFGADKGSIPLSRATYRKDIFTKNLDKVR